MGKEKEQKMIEEEKEIVEEVKALAEKEQGPILDLIDKITDKDTTIKISIEDVGGRLLGRSLRILGKISIDLGTLRNPR